MTRTRTRAVALGLLILPCARPGLGRDDVQSATLKPSPAATAAAAIVPTPPAGIPDDPPPHEGAMIDVPYFIEAPDILVVEVLEGLPGRPITGERLVRPDGTISLGFYGEVHVRGLTVPQAKAKIIHHLREFLVDRALGLVRHEFEPILPLPPPGTELPMDEMAAPGNANAPSRDAEVIPPVAAPPAEPPKDGPPAPPADPPVTKAAAKATERQAKRGARRKKKAAAAATKQGEPLVTYAGMQQPADKESDAAKPGAAAPAGEPTRSFTPRSFSIDPKDSDRVYVDVAGYNSKVYFVLGDVGSPGRLPITGKETVLDALNYGGGLTQTAEPADIHLYRPARGGKPARDYPIDLAAIRRGEARANLQVFDGDRLVVGRNAIVQKTIAIDRAAAPFNSLLNAALQFSFTSRSIAAANGEAGGAIAAWRDASLRKWFDLFKDLPGGPAEGLDPARVLDAGTSTPPAVAEPGPRSVPPR